MVDYGDSAMIPDRKAASEERLLVDHLRRLDGSRENICAVYIHLSDLRQSNRKPNFIRIAARSFETLVNNHDAALFPLSTADMVLVCREVPIDQIDAGIYKVRALFGDDPLTAHGDSALEDRFTTWYDLAQQNDYASLVAVANDLAATAERLQKKKGNGSPVMSGSLLTPKNLSVINQKLRNTRIADLIYQQPAMLIKAEGKGEFLFWEHFVSMSALQKRVAPGVNLFSSPWLFQYLTETLDQRMLAVVGRRNFDKFDQSISLNLNITTIISRGFQNFHRKAADHAGKIIIEMQLINVFSDTGAYAYARDLLQERGYRVLIDGLSPLSIQFFDPSLLRADLVKINWGPEFVGEVPDDRVVELRHVAEQMGHDTIILGRVDSDDAVKWGLNIGITRFQGYYIDKIAEALTAKGGGKG